WPSAPCASSIYRSAAIGSGSVTGVSTLVAATATPRGPSRARRRIRPRRSFEPSRSASASSCSSRSGRSGFKTAPSSSASGCLSPACPSSRSKLSEEPTAPLEAYLRRIFSRASSAMGQHAVAEELDRLHDLGVRRAAGVSVPQPQEEVVRARRVLPAVELAHARLRIAHDEPVGSEIGQRKLRTLRYTAKLREPLLPVLLVRAPHLRPVYRLRPLPRPGPPAPPHPPP